MTSPFIHMIYRSCFSIAARLIILSIVPVSVSANGGSTLYETGLLQFSTSNQSMWETGNGVAPGSETYTSSWNASTSAGVITGSAREHVPGTGGSITNPEAIAWDLAWASCRVFFSYDVCRYGSSALGIPGLGSRPSSTIPNPIPAQYIDTRTGTEAVVSTSGEVGITSSFGVNGGTVDAAYEFSAAMSYPSQVRAGQFFSLNPVSSQDSEEMITTFPTLTGRIFASMKVDVDGTVTGCFIGTGCSTERVTLVDIDIDPEFLEMNTPNLPPDKVSLFGLDELAFDVTTARVFADLGPSGVTLSLPGFTRPPLAVNLGDLTLNVPASDLGNKGSFENGKLVSSSDFEDVVKLNVDLDVMATLQGALPPLGGVINAGPFSFRGDLLDMGAGPTVDIVQDFELTATLMVRLDFDYPVLVRDFELPGERAVNSITAPFGELPDIALIDGQTVTVDPTFFLSANFDNYSELSFDLTFFQDILKGRLSLSVLAFPELCLSCEEFLGVDFGGVELFDGNFELGGFNTVSTESFTLITNHPPQLHNVPDDTDIEGNTTGGASDDHSDIVTFLNQVVASDVEDDDSTLVITTSPTLPELLTLNSSTGVTFSVTDSFGDTTTAQSTLTVVDTTPPVLTLGNLTAVAEGPLGTAIPDASMVITDWLSELVVLDIVDDSPIVDDDMPSFLHLGTTSIGFIATDSSGNQASIDPTVYLKAAFSLFAENSIVIDKRSVVESGIVAVPAATSTPWLSKDAQVDIDRYTVLGTAAPLYSDSVRLEGSSLVNSAFINELSGKGRVINEHAFLPGIYFPLDGLPGYAVGSQDIVVGCRRGDDDDNDDDDEDEKKGGKKKRESSTAVECVESGLILDAGEYRGLKLDKGDRRSPTTLYLSGGVYSFDTVELAENTQLVALESSLVLVANTLETDKNVRIGPESSSLEDIQLVVMVDGSDVVNGRRGDDDDEDDKKSKLRIKHFAVSFDRDNDIAATVYVPNGSIEVGKRSEITGALIGKNIDIGEEVIVRFDGDI